MLIPINIVNGLSMRNMNHNDSLITLRHRQLNSYKDSPTIRRYLQLLKGINIH